jgi:hypothetical protein
MPIITNNIIVAKTSSVADANNQVVAIESNNPNYDPSQHHILVVDGKTKIVSKKSSYLLDMLTLDDE